MGIDLEKYFIVDERKYPLVLGAPFSKAWQMEFALPSTTKKVSVPKNYRLETPCITYERIIDSTKNKISIQQKMQFQCEKIPAEEYLAYKGQLQKFRQIQEEEVVLTLK